MIVCHCKVVSDRDIIAAADQGAVDLEAVERHSGAGSDCQGCHPHIAQILDRMRELAALSPVT